MRPFSSLILPIALLMTVCLSSCARQPLQSDPELQKQVQDLENRVLALEKTVQEMQTQSRTNGLDALVDEEQTLRIRVGDLARRIEQAAFERYGGPEKALLDYQAGVEIALKAIGHEAGQPYFIEDVSFISDFKALDPQSPSSEAWEYLLLSPNIGRFYIAVDARTRQVFFTNKLGN